MDVEIICEICKSKCTLIDGDYICQEGHISKYVQEMAEELNVMLISKNLRKKQEKNLFKDYDISYKTLLMHNLLFCYLAESQGIQNEKYFSYFVNFLSGDTKGVFYEFKLDWNTLAVLLYLSKREEVQKKNELIFFNSFVDEISRVCLEKRIKHFKQVLVLKKSHFLHQNTSHGLHIRTEILNKLSLKGHPISMSEHRLYKETGLPNPQNEYNKILFRKDLRLTLEYLLKYLKHLTGIFNLEVTSEMIFYFEKFVYMREFNNTVAFPEDEVCYFLFLYDPSSTTLEDKILSFLRTNSKYFRGEVQKMLYKSGCNGHSRFFSGTFFYQRYLVEKKFYSFEFYLRRLKNLLVTKKNLSLKKEYVESDMI
ncbi:hypothetical protein NGRA_1460 [Nosema granulosis]|uniref:Uncharacterized protein n=1 Tax=Nosema granulosis TaxID=83296 RepID=A0A9P6GYX1_9MICR|nr:hypothetical protein NGRA_1460 [Nosema granulosis]